MKTLLLVGALVAFAAVAIGRKKSTAERVADEVLKRAHLEHFVAHGHDALVHIHEHPHVTHNRREGPDEIMGEWEHLTSTHTHEHNHAAVSHSHLPHESAEHEHLGEAHIHDHSHPAVS